jgi:hypothetical protein
MCGANFFLLVVGHSQQIPATFIKPEVLLLYSQEHATGSSPEPADFSPHSYTLFV